MRAESFRFMIDGDCFGGMVDLGLMYGKQTGQWREQNSTVRLRAYICEILDKEIGVLRHYIKS